MILKRYYDEFWIKMKITDENIRSILIYLIKTYFSFSLELKTTKDNNFWF